MTVESPWRHRARLARRIVAFAGAPFLSLVAPFFFLPVLSRLAGVEAWVAIAVGQSVGAFAGLLAGLGYTTLAPPTVAASSPEARRRYLATSVHVRVPVWIVAAAIAVVIAAWQSPAAYRADAALTAVALSLAGLAPTWYWVGVGRAVPIVLTEVLPRAVAMALSAVALLLGGDLLWYPALLIVAMIAGPAWVYARYAGGELRRVRSDEVLRTLRKHPPAVIAETAAGAYNALAVTLVNRVTPLADAARYVSGDKAYRIGQYAVSSLGNALQGWVVERDPRGAGRRMRIAVVLHLGLGVAGGIAFAAIGPWLTRFLFTADVAIDRATAVGMGIAILGIACGTVFGRIGLVMVGARHAFMVCVVAASVVGATSLLVAGSVWGVTGAAFALGLTELGSGIAQAIVLRVVWTRRVAAGLPVVDPEHSNA